jgi:hypothetical protein
MFRLRVHKFKSRERGPYDDPVGKAALRIYVYITTYLRILCAPCRSCFSSYGFCIYVNCAVGSGCTGCAR